MNKLVVLGVLIVATSLEATGDAVVRMGIAQDAWVPRSLLFLAGTIPAIRIWPLCKPRASRIWARCRPLYRDAVNHLANRQFRCLSIRP